MLWGVVSIFILRKLIMRNIVYSEHRVIGVNDVKDYKDVVIKKFDKPIVIYVGNIIKLERGFLLLNKQGKNYVYGDYKPGIASEVPPKYKGVSFSRMNKLTDIPTPGLKHLIKHIREGKESKYYIRQRGPKRGHLYSFARIPSKVDAC